MTWAMVASAGGHLAELHALRHRMVPPGTPLVWLTFDTPQSRELLAGETIVWLPEIPPRGVRQIFRSTPSVRRALREHGVTKVLSTGSGIALAVFPLARALRIPCVFVDSVACLDQPSQTGRIISRIPGVVCCSQTSAYSNPRWRPIRSILDDFVAVGVEPPAIDRLLVTLGTIKPYAFSRLIRRVAEIAPDGIDVVVQYGSTPVPNSLRSNPRFRFIDLVAPSEIIQLAAAPGTAVISHAGAGSALSMLEIGRRPVLVPRKAGFGEHVDDHQQAIAAFLDERQLAVGVGVEELSWSHVLQSTRARIEPLGGHAHGAPNGPSTATLDPPHGG